MSDAILEITYLASDRHTEDAVEGLLFLSATLGSSIDERNGRTVVTCYFADAAARDDAARQLEGLPDLELRSFEAARQDWLELYRQSLRPIETGSRFIVAPDESLVEPSDRLWLVIPQERAFGTGSHETTALCLEALEALPAGGGTCVDIGTGTGILAIALAKLGARRVIAFDNDAETFGIFDRNAARNRVDREQFLYFIGGPEAVAAKRFADVVVMNILAGVIIELLPHVVPMVKAERYLVLSGVLTEHRDDVLAATERHGLRIEHESVCGEWWCGVLRRR